LRPRPGSSNFGGPPRQRPPPQTPQRACSLTPIAPPPPSATAVDHVDEAHQITGADSTRRPPEGRRHPGGRRLDPRRTGQMHSPRRRQQRYRCRRMGCRRSRSHVPRPRRGRRSTDTMTSRRTGEDPTVHARFAMNPVRDMGLAAGSEMVLDDYRHRLAAAEAILVPDASTPPMSAHGLRRRAQVGTGRRQVAGSTGGWAATYTIGPQHVRGRGHDRHDRAAKSSVCIRPKCSWMPNRCQSWHQIFEEIVRSHVVARKT